MASASKRMIFHQHKVKKKGLNGCVEGHTSSKESSKCEHTYFNFPLSTFLSGFGPRFGLSLVINFSILGLKVHSESGSASFILKSRDRRRLHGRERTLMTPVASSLITVIFLGVLWLDPIFSQGVALGR